MRRKIWGNWKLNEDEFTLENTCHGTKIHLDGLSDSASMLDWVFQTNHFTTKEDTADLLDALDEILGLGHVAAQNRRIDPWRFAFFQGYDVRPNTPWE